MFNSSELALLAILKTSKMDRSRSDSSFGNVAKQERPQPPKSKNCCIKCYYFPGVSTYPGVDALVEEFEIQNVCVNILRKIKFSKKCFS